MGTMTIQNDAPCPANQDRSIGETALPGTEYEDTDSCLSVRTGSRVLCVFTDPQIVRQTMPKAIFLAPSLLFCGSGEEPDVFQNLVDVVDTYCEDDAGEWIPVLEERVRASLPEVKKFLASGQKLKE